MAVDLSKEARIKREKTKLRRLLKDIEKDRLKAAEKLIGNVAFMGIELDDLQETIGTEGWTSEYQNGANQWGTKKSPEAEVYTALMQRYLPAVKQLFDLLPDAAKPLEGDALLGFINRK